MRKLTASLLPLISLHSIALLILPAAFITVAHSQTGTSTQKGSNTQTGNNTSAIILPATERAADITASWEDRAQITDQQHRAQITDQAAKPAGRNVLWYRRPAGVWEEALPVGNGRLGAMIFGGVADERIQLNESTLWDGYPLNPNNPEAFKALPEVRRLLFENKNNEAVELADKTMMGKPKRIKPYQSLGELWLDEPSLTAENYTRSLDLSTAVATVKYTSGGVKYMREYFASLTDGVIVMRFTAGTQGKINLRLTLRRQQDAVCTSDASDAAALILEGRLPVKDEQGKARGLRFAAKVKAMTDGGKAYVADGVLHIENANSATLYIAGATNYTGLKDLAKSAAASDAATNDAAAIDAAPIDATPIDAAPIQLCTNAITAASAKSYAVLKATHIAAYRHYFNRLAIHFAADSTDIKNQPTNERIENQPTNERLEYAKRSGRPDNRLVELYFQYGRYLLISSSQPGSMPANLQGIWAWQMSPPWNADFHTNINVQMNYWPAEITNLGELHMPLIDLEQELVRPGTQTAKEMYGAKGWVVHHLTDAWGFTAPADGPQGIWPMGAAWLVQHPWEHYCYTGDKNFLAETGYPLMKGAAEFILDFLVEAPAGTACPGRLVTNPSYSPENTFILPDGKTAVFTYGATMDLEIIHNLLTNCIEATKVLNIDTAFRDQCVAALQRLAPLRISTTTGRIMEWAEDYKEIEPHHRHTSHLFGLYPGNQITVDRTPELAAAARKTLEGRGDGGTGWSLAWKINMWNRLHDGDHSYKLLSALLTTKTLPNLLDNHPPFQIDGNFGATAAIAEMLLQSQRRKDDGTFEIELLPALPAALATGNVTGLCARGGFIVDMEWKHGELVKATITSRLGGVLNIKAGSFVASYKTRKGEVIKLNSRLHIMSPVS